MKKTILLLFLWFTGVQSIAQSVETYQTYFHQGKNLASKGNFQEAVVAFNRAIDLMPYYSVIYLERGKSHFGLANYPKAVEDFSQAIMKNEYLVSAYLMRAKAYFELKAYATALQDIESIRKIEPNHAELSILSQTITLAQQNEIQSTQVIQNQEDRLALQYRKIKRQQNTRIIVGALVPLALWTTFWFLR